MGIFEQFRSLFRREPPDIAPVQTPEPAIAARALQVNERRGKERINAREGTRVLIIDDSKTVVTVLKKFLRSAGYETREAFDAESGLSQMHTEAPELFWQRHWCRRLHEKAVFPPRGFFPDRAPARCRTCSPAGPTPPCRRADAVTDMSGGLEISFRSRGPASGARPARSSP